MDAAQSFTWFVGIFEGEGSFAFVHDKPKRLAISMTDLDVLERVQAIVGGSLLPLKRRREHWKDAWLWSLTGQRSVAVAELMLPYLGTRRALRCQEYIANFSTQEMRRDQQAQAKALLVEKVQSLRKEGLTHAEIASRVGKERSYVTKILNSMVGMV